MTSQEGTAAVVIGLWRWLAGDGGWHLLIFAATVALVLFVQLAWLSRARSSRRWKAALDTYATREMSRAQSRNDPWE